MFQNREMENPSKRQQQDAPSSPALLPDDVMTSDILSRLPPKSVALFGSITKHYLSLTTDRKFILTHSAAATSSSPPSTFFLFPAKFRTAEQFPLNPHAPRLPDPFLSFLDYAGFPPLFLDSRNGLILLRQPRRSSRDTAPALCVCNPTTRSCHFIHVPASFAASNLHLVFDPSVSSHIRVIATRCGSVGHMFVYSSETREWKILLKKLRSSGFGDIEFQCKSARWNGCLIWNGPKDTLACLDPTTEQLRRLPKPEFEGNGAGRCLYLGDSRGCFHYIGSESSPTKFRVWEMKSETEGWRVLHWIDIYRIRSVCPEVVYTSDLHGWAVEVVCFLRGGGGEGEGEGDQLLLSVPGKIVAYHVRDRTFTAVCENLPVIRNNIVYTWNCFYTHTDTIFSL